MLILFIVNFAIVHLCFGGMSRLDVWSMALSRVHMDRNPGARDGITYVFPCPVHVCFWADV